jgi:hypothetical protein
MKRGLIPEQIGLATKVRPEGYAKISWEAWLTEQVEREDLREWARRSETRELRPDVSVEQSRWSIIGELKALIP